MWFTGLPAYRQHVLTVTDHAPHLLYNQTVLRIPSKLVLSRKSQPCSYRLLHDTIARICKMHVAFADRLT
jgi:hypothetical protein